MPYTVVFIGAVALGPKAACRFTRLAPDARAIMIDQGSLISYGGCGIPYFVSGDVSDREQLQSTSFHMLRDGGFFRDAKGIEVMTGTRALAIDRTARRVLVEHLAGGTREEIAYDRLVIATGSTPNRPDIPGARLDGVFTVSNLDEAVAIKERLVAGTVSKAVVIGAGAVGLEMAEAFADLWGIDTSVVEIADQVLPGAVSPTIAHMMSHHLREHDVSIYLDEKVRRLEGDSRVRAVVTDSRTLTADLVIIAAGVTPNTTLAAEAGLVCSPRGALVVNPEMQTSDPLIYAGGDCVEIPNLVTGRPGYFPLGSMANRQGRVIGTNLAGGSARFEGAVGSFIIKLFDISVATAGLTRETAVKEGFDAVSAFVGQFDRAHFYPEKELLYMELVVERGTGRVLGIQGLGGTDQAVLARVGAVAPLLAHRPVVSDISNLEFPYAPPFSSAMDVLNALGNTAENILEGRARVIDGDEFVRWWEGKDRDDTFFLDCRGRANAAPLVSKYPEHWKSIPQDELRTRLGEVPRDRRVVLVCNTGVRAYEAQRTLMEADICDTYNLQGGIAALKKQGVDL